MAILNITPDSFYVKSRSKGIDEALEKAEAFLNEGATLIDIGGYSSRPGAIDIGMAEELERILPVIAAIAGHFPSAIISVDTFRSKVAEMSIAAGAHLINDISAGTLDQNMFRTIAKLRVPYIMMHMKGTPQDMQQHASYEHVVEEVQHYFAEKITALQHLGIEDLIIDPGFGFAKTITHNYELLQQLESFQHFNLPVLVGFSRKSMVTKVLGNKAKEALNGTSILNTAALLKGASILRVHDVKEAVECVRLTEKIKDPFAHWI